MPIDPAGPEQREALTPEAFVALCEPARGRLWTLAAGLVGDRHDAEDLVQEAVCVALRRLDEFQPGTSAHAWLAKMVRMLAQNWNAKRKRRRTTPQDPVDLQPATGDQGDSPQLAPEGAARGEFGAIRDSFDSELASALDTLSPDARACLLLRTVQGMSYEEIAELVGVPAGTAMSHVHRARRTLRAKLSTEQTT